MAHLRRCSICGVDVMDEFICMDCFRAVANVSKYDKEEIKKTVEQIRQKERERENQEMLDNANYPCKPKFISWWRCK